MQSQHRIILFLSVLSIIFYLVLFVLSFLKNDCTYSKYVLFDLITLLQAYCVSKSVLLQLTVSTIVCCEERIQRMSLFILSILDVLLTLFQTFYGYFLLDFSSCISPAFYVAVISILSPPPTLFSDFIIFRECWNSRQYPEDSSSRPLVDVSSESETNYGSLPYFD